ncbi:tetratricopeptide repeat protein [Novosphingobium sp. KCTC 2891]|uniref:tetratricopeptide repeat protein n=1 Tax=Novosphingobium sp. KCTC 2891 TaxID=2989730 RepID=UPI0022233851|nr:tetratricopeptide repeat protein [Novosphingobium sp. KCTC 2891]MCW1382597.1 tetratricopeptide repeat protein [Novosphingobium sp. KCTC 2891]
MALRPNRPQSRADQIAVRNAAQQDVFLREVDDALREDQVFGAMRRYGRPVGIIVVAGLLGLAGYLWYDHHKNTVAGENGEAFTKALDQVEAGNMKAGADALSPIVKASDPSYSAAARLMQAGISAQQGKDADAQRIFAQVAADSAAPQAYRDLATVREVASGFDKMPPQQAVDRLKSLAVPGNPWFGPAGELVGIAQMKLGHNDQAAALFAAIAKDKSVPESLRRRVRQLAGQLGVDAVEDPEAAAVQVVPAEAQ